MSAPSAVPAFDFRRLVESVPNLVWTCRGDGPCDYLSPQWVAYTGRPAEEQLGYGWLEALHPQDRAPTAERWAAAVEARGTLDTEFRIRRHDGVYRWFATRAVPELDADGTIVRWYGTNTDIEDRRTAEAELQALQRTLELRVGERTADLMTTRVQLEMAQRITRTGSWSFDLDANHVQWSAELFRIFRLPVSDICPQYSEQPALFHPDSWPLLDAAVTRAAAEGVPYQLELRLADSSEGPRYAMASCEVIQDGTGRVRRLYGTFQDVTELARTRRERDAALERMRLATSFAGIGVWDWDLDDGSLVWNDQMYRLLEVPEDQTPSYDAWRSAVHPDDLPGTEALLRHAIDGTADFVGTYRAGRHRNGWRVIRAFGRRNEAAGHTHILGICVDVTAEVRAEELRTVRLATLREFIRNAPAAIAIVDQELRYLDASDRWPQMFGLPPRSSTEGSLLDDFPRDRDRWRQLQRDVLAGATLRQAEDAFRRRDGSLQYVQWEARPWFTEAGDIGGMMLFAQDVTDAVILRRRLEQQSRELQRSNDDLQQFAYAASHDLQEPLRAIAGFAQILGRRYTGRLDADADEIIAHMTDGAKRMRSLIDGLLSFSRAGSGNLTTAPVALDAVVSAALDDLSPTIRERDPEIERAPLPVVRGDHSLLMQVMQNLLGNALKYTADARPRIRISAVTRGAECEVIIRDWGIGIPPESMERVFQIFQRLHTREEYSGTGIGLALCRRIIDRLGGRIWFVQPDGPGSEVHFTLPLAAEPPVAS